MLYVVLALISGCLVILSMVINSHLAKKIGVFQGTFVNYLVGLLFISMILIFKNEFSNLSFNRLSPIPFWAYLGGLIGVSVVAISNIIIPKIPTIYSTLLIFLGQLFTGIGIDYFRGSLISKGKIIGGLFIIAGLIYNFNVDKQDS
ncbi:MULTISPECIES: DMT family transporter [unclassified Clostridium]|uniref:DMT family transporter n=1 Tax=unclassified Clostridium TaxID=2614128 RepID=UPI001F415DA0|nr:MULTISPECIES: DMT family transporter [unclassified Clostridium]MCF6460423.1 hypothetical protein [Clostridium sp. Cult3]WMJ79386.1 DMT family transporter [Clostridium sp. MB40-C1]